MRINALVMSRSYATVKVLVSAFAELGIEYRVSASTAETLEILTSEHHSALIVDFDLPDSVAVVKMTRTLSDKRRPVVFGMIGATTPVDSVFQAGANFVLYKPLDLLQVLHSFRAARGFMREDRRRAVRQKSETLAYLQFPTGIVPALVVEVTEQGLSLQAAEALTPARQVPLRFLLLGTTHVVHASADFIWTDGNGRAGVFFSNIAAGCRRDLQAWLKKHGAKKSDAVRSLLEPQATGRMYDFPRENLFLPLPR
jgi:DNA-binding response OmpR family regulator